MFVYAWADGIYSTLRGEDDRLCLLILIGVNEQGEKRLLALSDGYRESPRRPGWASSTTCKCVWGLRTPPPPLLAVGGRRPEVFWAASDEAWPQTRHQRCRIHKTANVLNALPKSVQGKAKAGLHEIWTAGDPGSQVGKAFDRFARDFGAKYPKAVAILDKDRAALLAFYDFPAEH